MKPLYDHVQATERLTLGYPSGPPEISRETKLREALDWLGTRWLLHPANAPRKRAPRKLYGHVAQR